MTDLPQNLRTSLKLKMKWRGLGEFRSKPGEVRSLAMLVDAYDLRKYGIQLSSQRTIRNRLGKRSRRTATVPKGWTSIAAKRGFLRVEREQGDLAVEITPCLTAEIASKNVVESLSRIAIGPASRSSATDARHVTDLSVPGVETLFAYEFTLVSPTHSANVKYIAGNVSNVVYTMIFTSRENSWSWMNVVSVGTMQAQKIRRVLNLESTA